MDSVYDYTRRGILSPVRAPWACTFHISSRLQARKETLAWLKWLEENDDDDDEDSDSDDE